MSVKKTFEVHILGLVQGVGFRPFVVQSAKRFSVSGWVKNSGGIVILEATGAPEDMKNFLRALQKEAPPGADITNILIKEIPYREYYGFAINASGEEGTDTPFVPPDLPLCDACREELYDRQNRRYMNPFISCVSCGPRYSIITSLPYDRCRTTMDSYKLCAACTKEYQTGGRRDFAQTISCDDCGPFLVFRKGKAEITEAGAFKNAVEILKKDGVLAIKGIGGYHFACSPFSAEAVRRLRLLKQRDKKPFAVLFKSVDEILKYCGVTRREEKLLLSSPRPIVLLPYDGGELQVDVCAESRYLGAFLPYSPLQELLMDACGPLVMTSANVTDQPILTQDQDVLAISSPYLDGVLYNTRRIAVPQDDSLMRVAADREQVLRRSRGIVPLPVQMSVSAKAPLFAAGADLKAAFCLMDGDRGYVSQHIGDLENADTMNVYRQTWQHMTQLFSIRPRAAACDLHPDYYSTRFAQETGLPLVSVQHHHAHIASVMAEHGITNKIIGVAFDGTGYGEDGSVWGGEFLVCEGGDYRRAGHLGYVPICGGNNAAKDALVCANSYLIAADVGNMFADQRFSLVEAAIKNRLAVQNYSSMGRLFDAVSAILCVKMYNSFEGECAIALENLAYHGKEPYPLRFDIKQTDGILVADQAKLAGDIAAAVKKGADKGSLALGFHRAVAKLVLEMCTLIRKVQNIRQVALSGGVFANRMLLEDCAGLLADEGFEVFINHEVPMNDGGISLGQAFVAAQKLN